VNYPPQGPPPGNYGPPQGHPGQWGPPPQQPLWPSQQWPPGPPPKKRNGWKWALGAAALLAVIGVTAAVTISVTSGGGDKDSIPPQDTYGLASADDKAPADVITEDPTCAAWSPINDTLAAVLTDGWDELDPKLAATDWTPEERLKYEEVGQALEAAAEQSVRLAKETPNRAMRELYEQFIAYARAFTDAIPSYTASDNHLATTAVAVTHAVVHICSAITYKSAQARSLLLDPPISPTETARLSDPSAPRRFMTAPDPTCDSWDRVLREFNDNTKDWQKIDKSVPATEWTPDQRAVVDGVIPTMAALADDLDKLGLKTENPVLQDLALMAAQYRRAHIASLRTYQPADNYLDRASFRLSSVIFEACKAARA
jgi:hypothetical protein